jgi:hypothetical protein
LVLTLRGGSILSRVPVQGIYEGNELWLNYVKLQEGVAAPDDWIL